MKLFPASASTRALESLASHAFDAPSHRPRSVAEEEAEERIDQRHGRAQLKAAEAFDDGVDERLERWVKQDAPRDAIARLALAAIPMDDDRLDDARSDLRELFVERCADKYLAAVDAEDRAAADEAEYDDWRWRHG